MLTDPMMLERLLVGGLLASVAVAVAFGPELGRAFVRLRSRHVDQGPSRLGVEAQQL